MTAVDTNVLVRLLTDDDPAQSAGAQSVFAAGQIWIAKTVFLETAWVLRSQYGFVQGPICDAFTKILSLKNVHVEDEPGVTAALALADRGMELADALHLSSRPSGASFVSFDRSLISCAKGAGISDVSAPSMT
jgi:predicted nucleic-acid-binding protein